MKQMLGAGAGAFLAGYDAPARRGLRINPMKISAEEFAAKAPFPVEPVPWVENGFYYPEDVRPAQHPWYRAGLYYLQEPSAMTPADRLPVYPGERVLDLCAAPGGKATQLAGRLFGGNADNSRPDSGIMQPGSEKKNAAGSLLVANEISNARAKALLRNLELFGTPGCFVTNERAERLAEAFPGYFDKILVDAPCSGEGMFHRQPEVASHWSPDRVLEFAGTQRRILEEAFKMLRPGGMLMYSTCTFSVEENEGSVAAFLSRHPEMQLTETTPYEYFDTGHPAWLGMSRIEEDRMHAEKVTASLTKCVRIWPHLMGGEGHFLALMRKEDPRDGSAACRQGDAVPASRSSIPDRRKKYDRPGRQGKNASDGKRRTGSTGITPEKCLQVFLDEMGITLPAGKIDCRRERLYLVPDLPASVQGLQFLRSGVYLGEVRKERFVPAQPFAMLLTAAECREEAVVSFAAGDARIKVYLSGQTITAGSCQEQMQETADRDQGGPGACAEKKDPLAGLEKGWKLVCVDGYGIGWAHFTNGVLKNKYAVSWR